MESQFEITNGYVPDIKNCKPVLEAYNRHADTYSVYDLRPEIILVSSLISHLLQTADFTDDVTVQLTQERLFKLLALKTKMIDSMSKIKDLEYKHKHLDFEREMKMMKINSIPTEVFQEAVKNICSVISDEVPQDKMNVVVTRLNEIVSSIRVSS